MVSESPTRSFIDGTTLVGVRGTGAGAGLTTEGVVASGTSAKESADCEAVWQRLKTKPASNSGHRIIQCTESFRNSFILAIAEYRMKRRQLIFLFDFKLGLLPGAGFVSTAASSFLA